MKILAICGSPRKGNTEFMLNTVLNEITRHKKELILLREKSIKHCTGCLFCDERKKECSIKDDDMEGLNKKLSEADIILMGSANYFDNVTGLLKDFIDRTNIFYKTGLLKGKKVYGLVAGGMSKLHSEKAMEAVKSFAAAHKMDFIKGLICGHSEDSEAKNQKELIKELKRLGQNINNQ
jgi:multimeric flavodoxin WrbA